MDEQEVNHLVATVEILADHISIELGAYLQACGLEPFEVLFQLTDIVDAIESYNNLGKDRIHALLAVYKYEGREVFEKIYSDEELQMVEEYLKTQSDAHQKLLDEILPY